MGDREQEIKFNILHVEDNPGDVRLTKEIFKDSAYDVNLNTCFDGEEAIEYLKNVIDKEQDLPDLIILDLNLPKKNGLELLGDIKSNKKMAHLPVIILTSSESESDIEAVYKAHANCYLAKPVDYEKFCDTIKLIEQFWFDTARLPKIRKD